MNEKMTLLFAKETGHVLAALTRAADAEAAVEASALAGEALPVRYAGNAAANGYGTAEVAVVSGQLAVYTADREANVLLRPRGFFVEDDNGQKSVKPLDQSVAIETDPTVALPALPVMGSKTQVKLSVSAGVVAVDTKVWIMLTGPDVEDRQFASGKFAAGGTATINVSELKSSTEYALLALVAGVRPHLLRFKSPA